MGKKTPPFPEYETWTTARFWAFVRSALRKAFTRWPPKYECLNDARTPYEGDGRQKWQYKCAECEQQFMQKEVEVDHIEQAGSLKTYEDLPEFVRKLFVRKEGMQVLCKPCHSVKTKEGRKK